jgi:hypothetical protein
MDHQLRIIELDTHLLDFLLVTHSAPFCGIKLCSSQLKVRLEPLDFLRLAFKLNAQLMHGLFCLL